MNRLWYVIIALLIITSCKPIKKITGRGHVNNIEDYIETKLNTNKQLHYFTEQIDLRIDDGDQRNAKAKAYISHGNFIFMSVNFLGFEVARAQISHDSLKFINRVSREYYFGSIDYMEKISGINLKYDEVESLLILGFPVREGDSKADIMKRFTETSSEFIYTYMADENRTVKVYFSRNPIQQYKIEIIDPSAQSNAVFTLSEYIKSPIYPGLIEGSLTRRKSKTDVRISIGNVEYKTPGNISFKVNSNYNAVGK